MSVCWVISPINNLFLPPYPMMPIMCPLVEVIKLWDSPSCLGGLVSLSALALYPASSMSCLVGVEVCDAPKWVEWEPIWFIFPHISLFQMSLPCIFQPWFYQSPNQVVSPLATNQEHICENGSPRKMFVKGGLYCLE